MRACKYTDVSNCDPGLDQPDRFASPGDSAEPVVEVSQSPELSDEFSRLRDEELSERRRLEEARQREVAKFD